MEKQKCRLFGGPRDGEFYTGEDRDYFHVVERPPAPPVLFNPDLLVGPSADLPLRRGTYERTGPERYDWRGWQ